MLTCVSFVEIKEYLCKLSCERTDQRTDRQTEVINTFQLSLESVKKPNTKCIIKIHIEKMFSTIEIVYWIETVFICCTIVRMLDVEVLKVAENCRKAFEASDFLMCRL